MLVNLQELLDIIKGIRHEGKKIVFTNGCFDILHAGHVTYLEKAKSFGDILILGLNSDDSVRRLKGSERPINNEQDRATVLSALRSIDYVVFFNEDTPIELISAILPDVLVKGGDYTNDTIVGADIVIDNSGKVEIVPLLEGRSTTSIINKMKDS